MNLNINCTTDGTLQYPMHEHSFWEIMFYIEGEGYMRTQKDDYPFTTGTAIIMPPNTLHGSSSENGFKNISIGGDFGHFLISEFPVTISDNEFGEGEFFARTIYRNRYGDATYLNDLTSSYIRFLLQRSNLNTHIDSAVNQVYMQILENAYNPNIDVTEILKATGYAEDYIRKCFTNTIGISPLKFLTKVRMDHACSLLDIYRNSIPLYQIAEKCGYYDYVYFSKIFKSYTQKSPAEYTKKFRL